MQIACNKQNQALVMALNGRLDRLGAMEFEKTFSEWQKKGELLFVIDMKDVEYISSAGLRSFLFASQQLKGSNGQFRLCNMSKSVHEIFTISGFDSLFPVYQSYADAMKFN